MFAQNNKFTENIQVYSLYEMKESNENRPILTVTASELLNTVIRHGHWNNQNGGITGINTRIIQWNLGGITGIKTHHTMERWRDNWNK